MESNLTWQEQAAQLAEMQRNKNCTNFTYSNPVILYPTISLLILAFSSLLTLLKLQVFNIVLLPFKILAGLIMILMFTIILVLICNFFSNTSTWIFMILFLLITVIGAPILIYFGGALLIAVLVLGVSGTTIASIMYYFKDKINEFINGPSVQQSIDEVKQEIEQEIDQETDKLVEKTNSNNLPKDNNTTETSNITANTINDTVEISVTE